MSIAERNGVAPGQSSEFEHKVTIFEVAAMELLTCLMRGNTKAELLAERAAKQRVLSIGIGAARQPP
jgi:hypothetical protein